MHPLKPPFPVDKKRPVQFVGSQASSVMLEMEEVWTNIAMRQRSTGTIWAGGSQVATPPCCGREMLVPAWTCWAKFTITLGEWEVCAMDEQAEEGLGMTCRAETWVKTSE